MLKLQEQRMRSILVDCAKKKTKITYSSLGVKFGLYPRSPILAQSLGAIGEDCEIRGEPPINSLCVQRDTGCPGEGYYKCRGTFGLDWSTIHKKWMKDVNDCYNFKW